MSVGVDAGKTVLLNNSSLDEELGYIELYRSFIDQVKNLEAINVEKEKELKELREMMLKTQAPVILTEGKTDSSLLKLAMQKLSIHQFDDWTIKPVCSGKTQNNNALLGYLTDLRDNTPGTTIVIGMFDRDTELFVNSDGGRKIDIRSEEYVKLADNIYAFAIPVPHERPEIDQISIEHYFTDSEIKTEADGKRLFLGNEFFETGVYKGDEELYYKAARNVAGTIKIIEHESNKYVTKSDGTGDYSISKSKFVELIEGDVGAFKDISFLEFQKIFDVLQKILNDSRANN